MNSKIIFSLLGLFYGMSRGTFRGVSFFFVNLICGRASLMTSQKRHPVASSSNGHKFVKNGHLEKIENKTQLNVICPSAKMFVHSSEIQGGQWPI